MEGSTVSLLKSALPPVTREKTSSPDASASLQGVSAPSARLTFKGVDSTDGIRHYPVEGLVSSADRDMGEPLAQHNARQVQYVKNFLRSLPASPLPESLQQQAQSALSSILADAEIMTREQDHDSAGWVLDPLAGKVRNFVEAGMTVKAFQDERLDSPVTNFAPVLPGNALLRNKICRGGQPSPTSLPWLKAQGFKTIISFRDPVTEPETAYPGFSMDDYRQEAERQGFQYVALGFKDRSLDFKDKTERFFEIVNNPDNWPVYIHCRAGLGRTGLMSAATMKSRGYNNRQVHDYSLRRGLRPLEFADHCRQTNEILKLQVPKKHERPLPDTLG